jgi:endoglucanase
MEVVRQMGLGWNLGNTLECTGDWIKGQQVGQYETAWGNPLTTKEMIDGIRDAGFKSVRIPVAWSNMVGNDYTISPALMKRVQQVVGWVLDDGMIAVLNIHWDGGWMSKFPVEYDKTMKRYTRLWSQIAGTFKDFPGSLIFESLNEDGCFNDVWNRWGPPAPGKKQKAYGILNNINQAFVDLVRKSGGLNAKRHLLIAGYATDIDLTADPDFLMPKDPENHCIVSIHYYTPYTFAGLVKDESWGKARPTWGTKEDYDELDGYMQKLKTHFLDRGVPVIMGEYDATVTAKEPESVRRYILSVAGRVYRLGMCPMLWDAGSHFNRKTLAFDDPQLLEGFQKIGRGVRIDEAEFIQEPDGPAPCAYSIPEDILRQARKTAASPEGTEYEKRFSASAGDHLDGFRRLCTIETPQKEDFLIVLRIEKSGRVSGVYASPNDPIAVCVAGKLAIEKCPRPPFAPYFELIEMKTEY